MLRYIGWSKAKSDYNNSRLMYVLIPYKVTEYVTCYSIVCAYSYIYAAPTFGHGRVVIMLASIYIKMVYL